MHHDNVPNMLLIDFRGDKAAICYEIPGPGTEGMSFWFADGREWPEDLRDEEVGAICEAIERHRALA